MKSLRRFRLTFRMWLVKNEFFVFLFLSGMCTGLIMAMVIAFLMSIKPISGI